MSQVINQDEKSRQEQLTQEVEAAGDKVVGLVQPEVQQPKPQITGQPDDKLVIETEGKTSITSEPVEEAEFEVGESTPEVEGAEQPE